MQTQLESLIIRKVITTFVATSIPSLLFAYGGTQGGPGPTYQQGMQFIGWFLIFFSYMGAIVLVYGNVVSTGIEYVQNKWFKQHDWAYVLILTIFGLAFGLFSQETLLAIAGMIIALFYAGLDKWIGKRMSKGKPVKWFVLLPIVTVLLSWGYFYITSPPMPPFTKEDAVERATSGEGTAIDNFPKEIGEWEGMIDGYQVTRESIAQEIEEEVYNVTFQENWSKGTYQGSWSTSFIVDRSSSTATTEDGNIPPYYEENQK